MKIGKGISIIILLIFVVTIYLFIPRESNNETKHGSQENNICILLTEASSSNTAFYSYTLGWQDDGDPVLTENNVKGNPHSKNRIDVFAEGLEGRTADQYYEVMVNPVVKKHIDESECSEFYWGLYATGGMRDNVDTNVAEAFYKKLRDVFNKKASSTNKKVVLSEAKTIAGQDEGSFAWISLHHLNEDVEKFAMVDVGGQTMQFSTGAEIEKSKSWSLGSAAARIKLGFIPEGSGLGEVYCNNYNGTEQEGTHFKYNGPKCREQISTMLAGYEGIPKVKQSSYKEFFGISTFYGYFITVCGTYYPEYLAGNLNLSPTVVEHLSKVCDANNRPADHIKMSAVWYKKISDEVCAYWNPRWDMSDIKYRYANYICYAGNYVYELLRKFGLEDNAGVSTHNFWNKDFTVEKTTWSLGAAYTLIPQNVYDLKKSSRKATHHQ